MPDTNANSYANTNGHVNGAGIKQRTLTSPTAKFRGVGLHSGKLITIQLLPAKADTGISFVRTDLDAYEIKASTSNVKDTLLATTLVSDTGVEISTVEHLLSALCACGVDNVEVHLDGSEIPIMDGSAVSFITMIRDCGLQELDEQKVIWQITKEVSVETKDGRKAKFSPYHLPSWEITIDFPQPVVRQCVNYRRFELSNNQRYIKEIARARTFGFMDDFDMMRDHNRALGGSFANAVVLSRTEILNEKGLRQQDEFVAHKLLDVIGDCYINAKLVLGHYQAFCPGHALNHELMTKLMQSPDCYTTIPVSSLTTVPDFGPLQVKQL